MTKLTLAHLTLGASPAENIDAAAAAGFHAVGLRICGRRPGDHFSTTILGHPQEIVSLRRRARDAGITISNISAYQFYPEVRWDDIAPVIDATHALGARTVVVNGFNADEPQFLELFSRYCEAAQSAGLRVALEFLPYSAVRDLASALRLVKACGFPSAGLLLDALHLERSGGHPRKLLNINPEQIVFAQLCDARRRKEPIANEDLMHEARFNRLPAGEGDLPLFEFLDALPPGLEIEYEVARQDMVDRSPLEKAQAAKGDAERFLTAYAIHRPTAVSRDEV